MNVARSTPKALPAPRQAQAESKKFNYTAQDPATVATGETTIDSVTSGNGDVSTETVVLDNKKAVFFFGRLIDIKDDPNYKLNANQDGNFVFGRDHESFTGANVFGAAAATVNKYNEVYTELTGKKIDWAFGKEQLKVSPETGTWPNAFYARQLEGVHFFDVEHTSTGNSGEVASHEVGHAVLDAIRPGYFSGSGPETGAFHEAFGDVLAMLMTLGDDAAVAKIVEQTSGGDLSANFNALSDMGEDFGQVLGMGNRGIRSSFNKFTYKDPATLPERGDDNNLGHEVHDFSRLWSGAFYDVLDGIADANREAGMAPADALKAAGEEGWKLLIGQMEKSSAGSETTFKSMASHLLAGDAEFNGGARQGLIQSVMEKRELLPAGSGLFKSNFPSFSGNVVRQDVTLGEDFGALAGVKMETLVDQPAFGSFAPASNGVAAEAKKGVKLMMANDQILFTDHTPSISDLFKEDGTAYRAYVTTNAEGQRELHNVAMAVCETGHSHGDHGHVHDHHGNCNH